MKIDKFDTADKVLIIAEIGNNHEGNVELAKRMIALAARCGVDAVKFQTFQTSYYVSARDPQRFARLKSFELSFEQFTDLAEVARNEGVIFLSTPFDVQSAGFLNTIVPAFKIASGDNNFYPLLKTIAAFNKPMMISRGLADFDQIRRTISMIEKEQNLLGMKSELAILHCVTGYPVTPQDANLWAIRELQKEFSYTIGYSDHVMGIDAALAAVALGSRIIEKHFTLDKNYSAFRDHAISADPQEMAELVRRIREVETLLGKGKHSAQACEQSLLPMVRRSIVAARKLDEGSVLNLSDLTWIRPAGGLNPGQESLIVGRKLKRAVEFGDMISLEMVE